MSYRARIVHDSSALFVASLLLVSSPLARASRGPSRQSSGDSARRADLSFLKRGVTTRHEVQERLGWADAGIHSDRLFLARWVLSKEKGLVRQYGVADEADARDLYKDWKSVSILLRFDRNGVLEDYKKLSAARLLPALAAWMPASEFPPLDLSKPQELPVNYPVAYFPLVTLQGRLILGGDFLALEGTSRGVPGFHLPRASLLKVEEDHMWEPERGLINCQLTFSEKFRGKSAQFPSANPMVLRFDANSLLEFLNYLRATGYPFPER